jgi:AcrR family transcriptional regulator
VVTQRRRERERQVLRQAILHAALAIAAEEGGWQAVTIRKVAERIEYSPPTIYEHFASKEAMLFELMRNGFQQLLDELRSARAAHPDPQATLLRMARVYWDFAFGSPELYQVMMGLDGVPFYGDGETSDEQDIATQAFCELVGAINDLVRINGAQVGDPEEAAEIAWATLHGLVSLTMADCIEGGRDRATTLVERSMRNLLAAWQIR